MELSFDLGPVDPAFLDLLFGGSPVDLPAHDLMFHVDQAGHAGLTNTQRFLMRRGRRVPSWVWDLRDDRRCWKTKTTKTIAMHSVRLVPNAVGGMSFCSGDWRSGSWG